MVFGRERVVNSAPRTSINPRARAQRKGPTIRSFPVLGKRQLQVLGVVGDDHQIQAVPPGLPDSSFGQDLSVGVDGVDVEIRLDDLQAPGLAERRLLGGRDPCAPPRRASRTFQPVSAPSSSCPGSVPGLSSAQTNAATDNWRKTTATARVPANLAIGFKLRFQGMR